MAQDASEFEVTIAKKPAKGTTRMTTTTLPIIIGHNDTLLSLYLPERGEEAGEGRTLNISSSGVLFTSESMLLPGRRLELSISWPVQLNNQVALRLVARGRVVRFEEGRAAIEIQQYEFRTQAHTAANSPWSRPRCAGGKRSPMTMNAIACMMPPLSSQFIYFVGTSILMSLS